MKIQTLLKSIFSSAIIALLLSMMSCDTANPSALVGQWIAVSGKDKGNIMELSSDGTGVLGFNGIEITWKTESGRFYITGSNKERSTSYKLQGSVLTFIKDNGEILEEYAKCKEDCQEAEEEYAKDKVAALKAKVKKDSFTDSRDGKKYKTVKLDDKTWMAENLNYNAEGSKCYDNSESNCQKYGRLYNWKTAKSACPKGWHLPSDVEWQVLVDFASNIDKSVGTVLKASSGWESNGNGDDAIGFSALPGGYGHSADNFSIVGERGFWWSGREGSASYAYIRHMHYGSTDVVRGYGDKTFLYSVRCIQD